MMPEGFENNLYSWMLNFQYLNDEYAERYKNSRELPNDGDLFVYADPYWTCLLYTSHMYRAALPGTDMSAGRELMPVYENANRQPKRGGRAPCLWGRLALCIILSALAVLSPCEDVYKRQSQRRWRSQTASWS